MKSDKHAVLRLARNRDNVSERGDMSTHRRFSELVL